MGKVNKTRKIWWVAGAAVFIIIVIIIIVVASSNGDRPIVEVQKVSKVDKLVSIVTASGEIKPKEYVDLQSEIAGVIRELYVKEGDRVKKGDVLLRIDPVQTEADARASEYQMKAAQDDARNTKNQIEEAKLNLRITEAQLKSAEADLEQAKANLVKDKMSFKRKQQLHEENLISHEEYDLAKATFLVSKSRVDSAMAKVNQLKTQIDVSKINIKKMQNNYQAAMNRVSQYKAMLDRANDLLKKTVISSPLNGVITKLNIEKGERAVPGTLNNPAATLMTIADLSIIEAEVKVDETDIINVKLGQKVTVKVDALPDTPLKGHVTEIGNSAINAGLTVGGSEQAKDFKVVVQLDNPPSVLRPGLSATAEITTAAHKDVLAIPLQAVVMREVEIGPTGAVIHPWKVKESSSKKHKTNKKEIQGVFIVDKSGRAIFTPVKTGITGETKIEILSGIKEGDTVVVGSFQTLRTLKDGTFVIRKKVKKAF